MSFALGVVSGFLACITALCLLRAAYLAGQKKGQIK